MSLHLKTREEISEWLDLYRQSSGKEYQIQVPIFADYHVRPLGSMCKTFFQAKYEYSENTSIQGMWNSFTNVNPSVAVASFPMVKFHFHFIKLHFCKSFLFHNLGCIEDLRNDSLRTIANVL